MITLQDDAGRPKRLAGLATNVALALAVALSLAACGQGEAKDEHAAEGDKHAEHAGEKKGEEGHAEGAEELTLTAEEAERAGVKVEAIKAEALGETVQVTATIRPDQDRLARVAPRIEGRITSAPTKLGDRVRAGQTLATLDSVDVAEAHANWIQAQAEQRIADADFKRAESLNAEEIIPRKDFLRAQADRDKAAAAVRNAADRLRLLGGAQAASGSGVAGFAVTAPFAGTVIEKKVTLGELGSPSEPMFTIADLSRVWIQADLPEAALARVRVGANAKVTVPAYPGDTFSGRVGHIGAMLDKDTRTIAARIEVANTDGRLKPEMFATATIEAGGDKRDVISLPDAAIVLLEGQPTVFVYEQGAYEARQVEPGERMGGRTLLKSGIKAGDQVVTSGAYALKARKLKSQLGHGH
ncbi:efflux RND transporter periplasmic adaptor subunit [Methylibium petroleiphilum]|uniref:efflux RND transporter periplasmic adaptor subunit n=1 Tax=Methylibium petroleiphilum TaxID=105560 RepID=UPI003D2A722E